MQLRHAIGRVISVCRRFDSKFKGHIEFWVIAQMKSPVYCFFQV